MQTFVSSRGGARPFALTLADFEPPDEDGEDLLTFVSDVPGSALPARFADAFGEGVLGRLRSWSFKGTPPFTLRVRLRDALWRDGESTEAGFAWAGRQAALEFDRCFHRGRPARRYLTRWPEPGGGLPEVKPSPDVVRDVHIRRVVPSACGVFAIVTADFEPLPAGSGVLFDFVCELPGSVLPEEYADAFESGVRDALFGDAAVPSVAFRLRLHHAKWHEVDSNRSVFADAGRRAGAEALRRHAAHESAGGLL